MKFDFWTQWGVGLSDEDFAAAWAALGTVAGAGHRSQTPLKIRGDPVTANPATLLELARSALHGALSSSRDDTPSVTWRFPEPGDAVDADGLIPLAHVDARIWAEAWTEVAATVRVAPRLRVVNAPQGEPHLPWLRLLDEARPGVAAVSMAWSTPNASLVFEWPLRLGTLSAEGETTIATTLEHWPGGRLARRVTIDRDNANCDVLIHGGTITTLLGALEAQPFHCKANLVVIAAAGDADTTVAPAQLRAIAKRSSASGVVLWSQATDPATAGAALNAFIEEFSHDVPLDQALYAAAQRVPVGMAGAWLSDAIAATRLRLLAETLAARMQALPVGTAINVEGLDPDWAHAESFTTRSPDAVSAMPPGYADVDTVRLDTSRLEFHGEHLGASELAVLGSALADARTTPDTEAQRAARFLQQQSFVRRNGRLGNAVGGFVLGEPAVVRVRIGPPQEQWQSAPVEFPTDALPPGHQQWRLTVWLSEPLQLPRPLRKTIVLPIDGASNACDFHFTPTSAGRFESRITVLHRGRVLQTAVLRGGIITADARPDPDATPVLTELVPVRQRLGDLEARRQFDLAFVTNHTTAGAPRTTAVSAKRAWTTEVSEALEVVKDLNTALSRVAKSVADYADGLEGENGRALLVELAKMGAWLAIYLIHDDAGRAPEVAGDEYIQIVSTRADATVPFEFIYDHRVPGNDAAVCPHWREALEAGKCQPDCGGGDAARVCPLGFWGLRKVIERQLVRPGQSVAPRQVILQSEPGRSRASLALGGTALFASSKRVPPAACTEVTSALEHRLGSTPLMASDWNEWARLVGEARPHFLLALPHTDGTGAGVTLEVGGTTMDAIHIEPAHVCPDDAAARPLVALLGCDTAGTADDYGRHMTVFRDRGAAIVIGTIATVFGEHAARVGVLLAEELLPNGAPPQRLGEALRALKRRALLDGLLMPLCVVAYGDADWQLVHSTGEDDGQPILHDRAAAGTPR